MTDTIQVVANTIIRLIKPIISPKKVGNPEKRNTSSVKDRRHRNEKDGSKVHITRVADNGGFRCRALIFRNKDSTHFSSSIITSQGVFQTSELCRSLERQIKFNNTLTSEWSRYFFYHLGYDHMFSLYMKVCGISLDSDFMICDWRIMKNFLYDDYHHVDVLTSKLFIKEKIGIVKVSILLDENEVETEFEGPNVKTNAKVFSRLVCKIVPRPIYGEQLMCYVKGDHYLTGLLKYHFIHPVFTHAGINLGSSRHSNLNVRLESCRRLQDGFDASIDAFSIQLAEAGYFLTNDNNLAQCFKCGGILQLKKFDFDPWTDHAYWHPSCPFLLESKGKDFITKVRKKLRDACDFSTESIFTFKVRRLAPVAPGYSARQSDNLGSDDSDSEDDNVDTPEYLSSASDYYSDFDEDD